MIIYSITHRESGKRYIGQTSKSLKRRRELHRNYAKRKSQDAIHRAIRKHGEDAFEWRVEAHCGSKEHLNSMERFFIALFETKGLRGYNMTSGGVGTPDHAVSVAARRKMSMANIGRVSWAKGKKLPSVSLKMMGNKNGVGNKGRLGKPSWSKGLKMSDEFREKCSRRQLGKRASPETRARMSAAHQGRIYRSGFKLSPETCKRMSEAHKGIVFSAEHRENLSIAAKNRKRNNGA